MQQVVSFPGLGLEFHLSNIAFHIASKPIYWYGILIMCGVILAVVYASRRCSAFGIKQDDMYDCVLFAVPLGIVCARIYYVIFEWEQYKNDLSEVFAIWHGGLAIYGGILGGILTGLFCVPELCWSSAAGDACLAAGGQWGGLFYTGDPSLFIAQIVGILITIAFVAIAGIVLSLIVKAIFKGNLRVTDEDEALGLDVAAHGESSYPAFIGLD